MLFSIAIQKALKKAKTRKPTELNLHVNEKYQN